MKATIQLLARVQGATTDVELARRLGLRSSSTLGMAKRAGRVSPELAAQLAELAGEPVAEWIAIAAAEQLPEPRRTSMLRRLAAVFVLGVVGLVTLATPYSAAASDLLATSKNGLLGIMSTQ